MNDNALVLNVITMDGKTHVIQALSGWSVMEMIRDAGLSGMKAECGGALSCATCHVYIDAAWAARIDAARPEERAMIDDQATAPTPTSRLSCQIIMRDDLNGMVVTIAPNPD